ncbi:MAG: DUF3445 domain-containing protein [Tepidisphaeraceae bacterium]
MLATLLPEPPFYFPMRHGRYDVAPGLMKFVKDLGGGDADARAFQIDSTFDRFRAAKLASRGERPGKYVCSSDLSDAVAGEIAAFVVSRLITEYPSRFARDGASLRCALTGETLALDSGQVTTTLDALACQVQEDLAIVSTSPDGKHWLSYAHICLPNGWAPAEKIGRSFAAIHEPVAGMTEMNRREEEFANIMVRATDGLVRFAWGVTFDDELNHHPDRSRTVFDPSRPRAFLRVERQTIWGFPRRGAALFTIRTYLYDCADLRRDPATRQPLVAALRSMSPESLVYKGLAPHADDLIKWLERAG